MTKKHVDEAKKRLCVLEPDSVYRTTCGPLPGCSQWQAHHILSIYALGQRPRDEYIEAYLKITNWNCNHKNNLTPLPTKSQYIASRGQNPINIPAHNIDHTSTNGYNDECAVYLQTKVWSKIKKTRKPHETDAQSLAAALNAASTVFKSFLITAGLREGGTQVCWNSRFPKNPGYNPKWYYPFSMSRSPTRRHPGTTRSLAHIFTMIR